MSDRSRRECVAYLIVSVALIGLSGSCLVGCARPHAGLDSRLGWSADYPESPHGDALVSSTALPDEWQDRARVWGDRTAETLIARDCSFVVRLEAYPYWSGYRQIWVVVNKQEAFVVTVHRDWTQRKGELHESVTVSAYSISLEMANDAVTTMEGAGVLSLPDLSWRDVPHGTVDGVTYIVSAWTPEGSNQFACDGIVWDAQARERLKSEPGGREHIEKTQPYVTVITYLEDVPSAPLQDADAPQTELGKDRLPR